MGDKLVVRSQQRQIFAAEHVVGDRVEHQFVFPCSIQMIGQRKRRNGLVCRLGSGKGTPRQDREDQTSGHDCTLG